MIYGLRRQRLNQRNRLGRIVVRLGQRRFERHQSLLLSVRAPVISDLASNDRLHPGLERALAAKQPAPHLPQRRHQRLVGKLAPLLRRDAFEPRQLARPDLAAIQQEFRRLALARHHARGKREVFLMVRCSDVVSLFHRGVAVGAKIKSRAAEEFPLLLRLW